MIADNSIVLKYSAKTVSIEPFINGCNMEKPQPPLYKTTRHSPAAFPETERKNRWFLGGSVAKFLASFEDRDCLCRNFKRITRLWVATCAGWSMFGFKRSETN